MLLLTATTDKLQLTTSAAGAVHVHTSWMDMTQADPPVVKGTTSGRSNPASITTAATTDIVPVPAATTTRNVKTILIRNTHATVANDVTVLFDQNGTDTELYKTNLLPGEQLEYVEGVGFFKVTTGFEQFQYLRKSSQQSFSATTFADITGMGFAIAANADYEVEAEIIFRSATATVGVGLGINGPASPVSVQGTVIIIGQRNVQTAGAEFSAGFTAYDSATPLSTAVEATGTDYVARMACLVENGANAGTLALRWRSETATATTVEAGSFVTLKRVG